MKYILLLFFISSAHAYDCQCELFISSPIMSLQTGSDKLQMTIEREKFSSRSLKSQNSCLESCQKYQIENLSYQDLKQMVLEHSLELQERKKLGFSCTGETSLKSKVVMKARLGSLKLGNVFDQVIVVNQEVKCFSEAFESPN